MFSKLKHTFIAATFCLVAAADAATVAVLEIMPSGEDANLSISEYRHLTDELRARARETLPSGYSVLTRDNIIQLLPKDEKEAERLAESGAIDIGRAIGAEYVTQGFVSKFAGMLTLTVELYESVSGNMLGSFVTERKNALGLLGAIREKAPALFAKITEKDKASDVQQITIPTTMPASVSANVPSEPKKSGNSFWVAIGLDVLGAAALGFGIYNNAKASNYHGESEKAKTQSEFDAKYKKSQDAQSARNIFYATGSALLLGGVAVHIWF